MSRPPWVTSGSAVERFMNCVASTALPHVVESPEDEVEDVEEVDDPRSRGKAIHRYLQDVVEVGPDKALALAPDDWRELCGAISLDGLEHLAGLSAEVAYAYNVVEDTARVLGSGTDRDYDSVTEDEVPCQLDVTGVSPDGLRGIVVDHKSGWSQRGRASRNGQLNFGALCLARVHPSIERVTVQLSYVDPGRVKPWVLSAELTALEIDSFAARLRARHREAMEMRAAAARGVMPNSFHVGHWCKWCPAKRFCGAQTSHLRAIVGLDWIDEIMRMAPMPPEVAADAYLKLRSAYKVMAVAERMVQAAARGGPPLPLGVDDEGKHHWFGMVLSQGNEELDGRVVREVLREFYPPAISAEGVVDDAADEVSVYEVTKGRLEDAVRKRAPKRQGAKTLALVLDEVRKRGGSKRTPKVSPREFSTKDGNPGDPPPTLPEARKDA